MKKHNASDHYKNRLKVKEGKYVYDPVVKNHLMKYFENRKCLDLGCGSGYYLQLMGEGSIGYDASQVNVDSGKENNLDIRLVNLDEWGEGEKEECELIFASHIIEHLLSPVKFIEHCRKNLDKGDIYIIGVPTEYSIDRIKCGYGFNEDVRHFYSFSTENMKYLLERQNFKIIDRYISYTFMGTLNCTWIENLLQKIVPFNIGLFFSKGYYYVCEAQ